MNPSSYCPQKIFRQPWDFSAAADFFEFAGWKRDVRRACAFPRFFLRPVPHIIYIDEEQGRRNLRRAGTIDFSRLGLFRPANLNFAQNTIEKSPMFWYNFLRNWCKLPKSRLSVRENPKMFVRFSIDGQEKTSYDVIRMRKLLFNSTW